MSRVHQDETIIGPTTLAVIAPSRSLSAASSQTTPASDYQHHHGHLASRSEQGAALLHAPYCHSNHLSIATPDSECYYPGLFNISGAYRFMNSTLQALASLSCLQSHLDTICEKAKFLDVPTPIIDSLRQLLQRLNTPRSSSYAIRPVEIIDTLTIVQERTNALFYCHEHPNAQEFFQLLSKYIKKEITTVDEEGKRDREIGVLSQNPCSTKEIAKSVFDGLTADRRSCVTCGYTEGVMHLSLDNLQLSFPRNAGACRLEDCLEMYTRLEILSDYVCWKCSLVATYRRLKDELSALEDVLEPENNPSLSKQRRFQDVKHFEARVHSELKQGRIEDELKDIRLERVVGPATKQIMIARPPPVLALHINRFMHYGSQYATKNSTRLIFPELLDITPYTISGYLSSKPTSSPPPSTHNPLPRRSSTPTLSTHTSHIPTLYRLVAVVCHHGQHSFGHSICYRRKPRSSSLSNEKQWAPPKLVDPLLVHKESHSSWANGDVYPQPPRSTTDRDPSASMPDSDCAQAYRYGQFLWEGEDPPEAGRGWLRTSDEAVTECGIEAVLAEGLGVSTLYYERVVMDNTGVSRTGELPEAERYKSPSLATLVPNSDSIVDHTQEAIRCLRIMNHGLQQDILGLGLVQSLTNAQVISRWPKMRDERISKELEYACTHWAEHLKKADRHNERLVKKLEKFVYNHLLHWIEVLSWINKLSSADLSLTDGIAFLESIPVPTVSETSKLLSEGQRLISNFGDFIAQAALQTYCSALPLIPNESLLHQTYSRDMKNNTCRVFSWRPEDSHGILTRSQQQQPINRIVFSCQPSTLFASWRGEFIHIWDSTNGMSCATLTNKRIALAGDFTAGASFEHSSVAFYNFLDTNMSPTTFTVSAPVTRVALSSDGRRLAAGSSDGMIKLWDTTNGSLIRDIDSFECGNQEYCQFLFSPNGPAGARLAFSSIGGSLKFLDANNGEYVINPNYPSTMHFSLAFSCNGSRLACLVKRKDGKRILTVWNIVNDTLVGTSPGSVGLVLAISSNGSLIATGGDGHPLQLWSRDRDALTFYTPPDLDSLGCISHLAFSPDDMLVIGFSDADSVLYDTNEHFIVARIPKHNPSAVSFSPDRDRARLAIGYPDGSLHLWDTPSFKASRDMRRTKSASVSVLAFSPDCTRLASGFEDGTIRVWDTECQTLPLASHIASHSARVTALAFRLDGSAFASGAVDGTIKMWDSDGVAFTDVYHFPTIGDITSLAFSGFSLAAATVDETVLWDIRTGKDRLLCQSGSMLLSFSKSSHDQPSRLLASFNRCNNDVTVWDISTKTCIAQFCDIQTVEEMAFTPDNSQLGGTVRLDDESESFCLFDVPNQVFRYLQVNEYARLFPMPYWQGFPVWLQYSGGSYIITGYDNDRFIDLMMVVLPKTLVVDSCKRACGSRMFALSNDGRIHLFKPLY